MYLIIKRTADILISSIMLLILSPLLIPVIIGLKLTGEGYIFYKQERVGFKNKNFFILKFATMLKDSPNMAGGVITTKKDPENVMINVETDNGKINVFGKSNPSTVFGNGDYIIKLTSDNGDITVQN